MILHIKGIPFEKVTGIPSLAKFMEGLIRLSQDTDGFPNNSLALQYPLISPGTATAKGPLEEKISNKNNTIIAIKLQ